RGRVTWVKSQWKSSAQPGQLSAQINTQLEGMDFTAYGPSARRSLTAPEARVARDTIIGDNVTRAAE
ncbi:hypothetical protein, partial [Paragemmobacter kunshanensis]|uniref:hypothetical protein n=1 Tax=Paragemmobacter kunshanensis TaxID=2583234 RepID=UPI0019D21A3E